MGARKSLNQQKGNLTVIQQQQKELEEERAKTFVGKEELKNPPNWLVNEIAIEEWKRIVKELEATPLFNNLDYNNLGVYCNSVAKYSELVKQVGMKFRIGKELNNLVSLELKYSDEIKKYASLLGLTLDGKLRLITGDIKAEANKTEQEFGEI
jgi:P27 family predicted phage terminase small subunit|nr:MAG TPA: terminase small subunit [Caudoviricetes sp.]